MSPRDLLRFWSYVKKGRGCWEWQGACFKKRGGYGQFSIGGRTNKKRTQYAHRVSYEIANGPLLKGQHVLHHCDNPPCVRPSHLSAGTQRDNVVDMMAKGRAYSKLRTSHIPAIRRLLLEGRLTQEQIGAKYGVGQDTISLIKHNKTWKVVPIAA